MGTKMMFVYNPFSGKGQIKNHLFEIVNIFSAAGYEITIHPTQHAKDALAIASELDDSYDVLVCSGGDGTLDEVVNGRKLGHKHYKIGYIPAGSTNDFAASLGIPSSMEEAAANIVNGAPFLCDLGRFNDKYFVYVAAFGFLAEVSFETPQDLKNMLGHSAYIIEALKRMTSIKAHHLSMRYLDENGIEAELDGNYLIGMITNSDCVGGFKSITGPDVSYNDGVFEVTLIPEIKTPMDIQGLIADVIMNDFANSSFVRFKTSRITFHSEEPIPWTLDGEKGGEFTDITIEVQKEKLPILIIDKH